MMHGATMKSMQLVSQLVSQSFLWVGRQQLASQLFRWLVSRISWLRLTLYLTYSFFRGVTQCTNLLCANTPVKRRQQHCAGSRKTNTLLLNCWFPKITVNSYNNNCYIIYSTLIKTVYCLWLVLSRDLCPSHYLNPSSCANELSNKMQLYTVYYNFCNRSFLLRS